VSPFELRSHSLNVKVALLGCARLNGVEPSTVLIPRQLTHLHPHPSCHHPLPPAPKGFNPVADNFDNYQFLYPFGWQEVSVDGADVVYKVRALPL